MDELAKTKSRLKMIEISFEQINNSRNDLIRQLTERELNINNKLRVLDIALDRFRQLESD